MKTLCALFLCLVLAGALPVQAEEFTSDNVRIHYTVQGKGEPVVLIHGLYSNGRLNWELPGITGDLARNFQVITLDCRGHGQSDRPKAANDYGAKMVEDIVRLLDHLKIPKARVAGYSLGGMIAMKLLVTHPDRVHSAVLGGMGWYRAGDSPEPFRELVKAREDRKVPAACMESLGRLAVTADQVKAVPVPVTMIVGDRDPCRRLYVEPLHRLRPDWPVRVVSGANHLTCFMKPDFKAQLEAALRASNGPSPK